MFDVQSFRFCVHLGLWERFPPKKSGIDGLYLGHLGTQMGSCISTTTLGQVVSLVWGSGRSSRNEGGLFSESPVRTTLFGVAVGGPFFGKAIW